MLHYYEIEELDTVQEINMKFTKSAKSYPKMCTLLHYWATCITVSGKCSLLHYHAKIITLSGTKFIALSGDDIALSGNYYIIRQFFYYNIGQLLH